MAPTAKTAGDPEAPAPPSAGGFEGGWSTAYSGLGCLFSLVTLVTAAQIYGNTNDIITTQDGDTPSPTAAPVAVEVCPPHTEMEKWDNAKAIKDFTPPYGATPYGYQKEPSMSDCYKNKLTFTPVGKTTALIPEAGDAKDQPALVADGQSGDVDFPFGDWKAIATVGEYSTTDQVVVGVPDGMGAYLHDANTIRVIVQSESYGTVHAYESYPYPVNAGTTPASYTGSHVQFIDYNRDKMRVFMENNADASTMVTGMGEVITKAKNLAGDDVGPRAINGAATTTGAHFSNTDKDGNWVLAKTPSYADWVMQSLCSAHLEEKEQWGSGIGLASRLYITNEEWMSYASGATHVVGLPAHAVDLDTTSTSTYGTAWALGSMTQGGFEKIIEFSTGETSYVAFAVSGYNGAFNGLDKAAFVTRREALGSRGDGANKWVWPKNICPAKVYLGLKGKAEDCTTASTDFLGKNGLRCGQMYGFAIDMSSTGPTAGLWRDAWHKDVAKATKGATVAGKFLPIAWNWGSGATHAGGSPDNIVNFEADGSWDFQDTPLFAPANYQFWNAAGNDDDGKKTEHVSPAFISGTPSAFTQTSTAGYFGDYLMPTLAAELGTGGTLTGMTGRTMFPQIIDASYYLWQGETDITSLIDLGGKGLRADGAFAYKNCDNHASDGSCSSEHSTFEDIDGFDVVTSAEGRYAMIFEDSGNDYGERALIVKLDSSSTPLSYKWMAQSGGSHNTRMMAKVGIPAGVNSGSGTHEFSGTIDLSGMLSQSTPGTYDMTDDTTAGDVKHTQEAATSINEKLIVVGLQCHNYVAGIVYWLAGDRGGQWLLYKPSGI